MSKKASKGSALAILIDHLGISSDATMAASLEIPK
ncbi:hypothetical protein [Oenococcus oeni]|nr:hypothetical protein [Oenococcus oeni]